jgi:hypothetical protein
MDPILARCGYRCDLGCDKLKTRMDIVEECLSRHLDVSDEDYRLFFRPYLSRAALTRINIEFCRNGP